MIRVIYVLKPSLITVRLFHFRKRNVIPFKRVAIIRLCRVISLVICSQELHNRQPGFLHTFNYTFSNLIGSIRIKMGIIRQWSILSGISICRIVHKACLDSSTPIASYKTRVIACRSIKGIFSFSANQRTASGKSK